MEKKTSEKKAAEKKTAEKKPEGKGFEERLSRLEELGDLIRKTEIPLDAALNYFEEGIKLAKALEKDLEKIEGRIEVLMNGHDAKTDVPPELGLFAASE